MQHRRRPLRYASVSRYFYYRKKKFLFITERKGNIHCPLRYASVSRALLPIYQVSFASICQQVSLASILGLFCLYTRSLLPLYQVSRVLRRGWPSPALPNASVSRSLLPIYQVSFACICQQVSFAHILGLFCPYTRSLFTHQCGLACQCQKRPSVRVKQTYYYQWSLNTVLLPLNRPSVRVKQTYYYQWSLNTVLLPLNRPSVRVKQTYYEGKRDLVAVEAMKLATRQKHVSNTLTTHQ